MSKYQKLDNNTEMPTIGTTTTTTTPTTTTTDDDEEKCTLFINNEYDNDTSHNNENKIKYNDNNNSYFTIDGEEHTMDIPLLDSASNNFDYDTLQHNISHCRCEIPGFAVIAKNKSSQEAKLKILCAISLCCVFMIIEFIGGFLAGSLAIMTDAAHLASDCISFIIGLIAIWLGSKPPDQKMSFGYKRMEVMGAIISILGIWMLTTTLVIVAVQRIFSNDYDLDANTMMTISAIGIIINIAMIFILHGSFLKGAAHGHSHAHAHAHSHTRLSIGDISSLADCENTTIIGNGVKHAHTSDGPYNERNLNLRAAVIHVLGDLVQSVGVFLASILIKFYPNAKFADPLCTILFSLIVIMTTVHLFKESIDVLLDRVPKGISVDDLEMRLAHIEGVKSVHHLHVWNHTTNYSILMAHLVIDLLSDSNDILDKATKLATSSKYNIKHCTIQIERVTS